MITIGAAARSKVVGEDATALSRLNKGLTTSLFEEINDVNIIPGDEVSSTDEQYKDAIKDSLKHCERLMAFGKEVYMVELDGKDANEIGFERFLNTIEQSQPLDFQSLLTKKLQLI